MTHQGAHDNAAPDEPPRDRLFGVIVIITLSAGAWALIALLLAAVARWG